MKRKETQKNWRLFFSVLGMGTFLTGESPECGW